MSKAVGVFLVLAGVGIASSLLAVGPDAQQDSRRAGSAERRTVTTVPAARPTEQASRPVADVPQPAQRRAGPAPAAQPPPVVVMLPYRVEPAPPTAKQKAAAMPRDRASLPRELQLELRRVGCYGGDLNGVWTPATRKAMKAFTDRVNATLPVDRADDILLTLVQAHQGEACGSPCPPGQGISDDGRCVPGALLAQAAKKRSSPATPTARLRNQPADKPTAVTAPWTTTAVALPAPLTGPPPIAGRMALAGPRNDAAPPTVGEPPAAASLVPPARSPGPQAGAVRPARQAKIRERPQRFEQRAYGRRGGFVESVLSSRHSLF